MANSEPTFAMLMTNPPSEYNDISEAADKCRMRTGKSCELRNRSCELRDKFLFDPLSVNYRNTCLVARVCGLGRSIP